MSNSEEIHLSVIKASFDIETAAAVAPVATEDTVTEAADSGDTATEDTPAEGDVDDILTEDVVEPVPATLTRIVTRGGRIREVNLNDSVWAQMLKAGAIEVDDD